MKKRRFLFFVFFMLPATAIMLLQNHSSKSPYTVGVILPMEHEALYQITQGIQKTLEEQMKGAVALKIKNAQGDPHIQRAMIEQLSHEGCDLLIPIGTSTSQMTLNLACDQKILCLAADSCLLDTSHQVMATALSDELSVYDSLSFLHQALPDIKKITLIYSTSEKIAKEVPLVFQAAHTLGMDVQPLMIQNMSELYTVSRAINSDSDAIFILKDHLIVSGIQTITEQATALQIPVMTSDEGSVLEGAAFAIGVKESDIGSQGALIAKKILEGTSPTLIPPQTMRGPFPLFVNRTACENQGLDIDLFCENAKKRGLTLYFVGE